MYDFESPFHPFSVLATRIREVERGKRIVIFDNGIVQLLAPLYSKM